MRCDADNMCWLMSYVDICGCVYIYGVAAISRLLKIIGLFCKRALHKSLYSAKETYNFKEPTSRSHPIYDVSCVDIRGRV